MDDTLTHILKHASILFPEKDLSLLHAESELPFTPGELEQLLAALEKEFGIKLSRDALPTTLSGLKQQLRAALELREQKLRRIFTVPNLLSLFRILLIPIYATIYLDAETDHDHLIAGIILAVSCITDLFDGFIARHFDQISRLGRVLDPFADKATQGIMLFCMVREYPIILWLLALFVVKESFQLIMGCWYYKKGQMLQGALLPGKISTGVLFISMIALVIFPKIPRHAAYLMIAVCAVVMAISFIAYSAAYFGKNKKVKDMHP